MCHQSCLIQKTKKPYAWISHQIKCLSQKITNAKSTQSPNLWQAYYKVKKEMHKTCHTAYNNYVASLVEEERITKNYGLLLKDKGKIILEYVATSSQAQ